MALTKEDREVGGRQVDGPAGSPAPTDHRAKRSGVDVHRVESDGVVGSGKWTNSRSPCETILRSQSQSSVLVSCAICLVLRDLDGATPPLLSLALSVTISPTSYSSSLTYLNFNLQTV
jgi:hypothetical protein